MADSSIIWGIVIADWFPQVQVSGLLYFNILINVNKVIYYVYVLYHKYYMRIQC